MLVLKVQKLNRVTYFMTEKLCFSNQYTANNIWQSDYFIKLWQTRVTCHHLDEDYRASMLSMTAGLLMLLRERNR